MDGDVECLMKEKDPWSSFVNIESKNGDMRDWDVTRRPMSTLFGPVNNSQMASLAMLRQRAHVKMRIQGQIHIYVAITSYLKPSSWPQFIRAAISQQVSLQLYRVTRIGQHRAVCSTLIGTARPDKVINRLYVRCPTSNTHLPHDSTSFHSPLIFF